MLLNISKKVKHTYRLTLFPLERSEKGLTGANQTSFLSLPIQSSHVVCPNITFSSFQIRSTGLGGLTDAEVPVN